MTSGNSSMPPRGWQRAKRQGHETTPRVTVQEDCRTIRSVRQASGRPLVNLEPESLARLEETGGALSP